MASDFRAQLAAAVAEAKRTARAAFVLMTELVTESVVDGSAITGAPGQPRDTGNLAASWQGEFIDATHWRLLTNCEYAPHVEENVRGVTFRNHGPHSVALTLASGDRLAAEALTRAKAS